MLADKKRELKDFYACLIRIDKLFLDTRLPRENNELKVARHTINGFKPLMCALSPLVNNETSSCV